MALVKQFKYLLRDVNTMRKTGHTFALFGETPTAPYGQFVSKVVDTRYVEVKEAQNERTLGQTETKT